MTATQAPTPGPLSGEQISALVQEQMHDCWYEICSDTGCHPLDIVQLGRKRLEYTPRHWTRFVGDAVAARLAPLAQIGETPCSNSSCSSLSLSDGAGKSDAGSSPPAPVEASGSERETERFRQMVEAKLAEAMRAEHADAPFPLDAHQAASYHRTRADLLGWVLDMLPPVDGPIVPLTTPARAEAQDEGAAGEPVAWQRRRPSGLGGHEAWIECDIADLAHYRRMGQETRPLYAHPSPTPAADADRVRIAVAALEPFAAIGAQYRTGGLRQDIESRAPSLMQQLSHTAFRRADEALAALKSTAAKEGGAL